MNGIVKFTYEAFVTFDAEQYEELLNQGYGDELTVLGYEFQCDRKNIIKAKKIVLYTDLSDETNPLIIVTDANLFYADVLNLIKRQNCFNNSGLFLHMIAINATNDVAQYFVHDEEERLSPYCYIAKGDYSLCFTDKYSGFGKVHKATPKELYDYFIGPKKPIVLENVSESVVKDLQSCLYYDNTDRPKHPLYEYVHKWLREIHGVCVFVLPANDYYSFEIHVDKEKMERRGRKELYSTYDEAYKMGIHEAIEYYVPKKIYIREEKKEYVSPQIVFTTAYLNTEI